MDIDKICEEYEKENDLLKKSDLAKKIVNYCEANQDEDIPNVAKEVYVRYLLGYGYN